MARAQDLAQVREVLDHLGQDPVWAGLRPLEELYGGVNTSWKCSRGSDTLVLKVYTDRNVAALRAWEDELAALSVWQLPEVVGVLGAGADPHPHLLTPLAPGRHPGADAESWSGALIATALSLRAHADAHADTGTWPSLNMGWLPAGGARLRGLGLGIWSACYDRALGAMLDAGPLGPVWGDLTPWNTIVSPESGSVTLLDPSPGLGPVVFDVARWCATASAQGCYDRGELDSFGEAALLSSLALSMGVALERAPQVASPRELAAAIIAELLNRVSFQEMRWGAGFLPSALGALPALREQAEL